MSLRITTILLIAAAFIAFTSTATAAPIYLTFDNGEGLSATATLEQTGDRELKVTLQNTSTALPAELDGDTSNQFLTSISFDLGDDVDIISGSAVLGTGAQTVNFDQIATQLFEGADVSGEWGYSNKGDKINLARNVITAMQSQSTKFGGANLDSTSNLNGPQGGLVSTPPVMDLGGLGGIQGPVVFTVNTNRDFDLGSVNLSTARVEYGSDAAFVGGPSTSNTPVPEPATLALLGIGGFALAGAWRHQRRQRLMIG